MGGGESVRCLRITHATELTYLRDTKGRTNSTDNIHSAFILSIPFRIISAKLVAKCDMVITIVYTTNALATWFLTITIQDLYSTWKNVIYYFQYNLITRYLIPI